MGCVCTAYLFSPTHTYSMTRKMVPIYWPFSLISTKISASLVPHYHLFWFSVVQRCVTFGNKKNRRSVGSENRDSSKKIDLSYFFSFLSLNVLRSRSNFPHIQSLFNRDKRHFSRGVEYHMYSYGRIGSL